MPKASAKVKSDIKNVIKIAIGEVKKKKQRRRRKPKPSSTSQQGPDKPFPPSGGQAVLPSTVGNFLRGAGPSPLYPYQILLEQARARDKPQQGFGDLTKQLESGLSNLRLELQEGLGDVNYGLLELQQRTGLGMGILQRELKKAQKQARPTVQSPVGFSGGAGIGPGLPALRLGSEGSDTGFFSAPESPLPTPIPRPSRSPPPRPPSVFAGDEEVIGAGGGGEGVSQEEILSAPTVAAAEAEEMMRTTQPSSVESPAVRDVRRQDTGGLLDETSFRVGDIEASARFGRPAEQDRLQEPSLRDTESASATESAPIAEDAPSQDVSKIMSQPLGLPQEFVVRKFGTRQGKITFPRGQPTEVQELLIMQLIDTLGVGKMDELSSRFSGPVKKVYDKMKKK